ncbi:MAG TPA: sulfotransferase domain-containing protein [Actinomycetota bacterium]|jgi:hypothetical protein
MSAALDERRDLRKAAVAAAKRTAWHTAASVLAPTSSRRVLPDYLIVGGHRCGTTSLHRYLLEHQDVEQTLLGVKGMHYFSSNHQRSWAWYRAHFPTQASRERAKRERGFAPIVGESSPYYMFHPLAPKRIAEHLPEVKLLALLRDPVERAYSAYQHMRYEGLERLPTFEEAVEAEPERLAGEVEKILRDPGYESYHHRHHAYVTRGIYADQLETLYSLFPKEQILVLDFLSDPPTGLQRVLDFLGLPPHKVPVDLGHRHNAGSYSGMSPEVRERLVELYRSHNQRLYDLLGHDFGWGR